jgi:hypothetical protein
MCSLFDVLLDGNTVLLSVCELGILKTFTKQNKQHLNVCSTVLGRASPLFYKFVLQNSSSSDNSVFDSA